MCVHNGLSWNCSLCPQCYPSVPTPWYQITPCASACVSSSSTSSNTCYPVSPSGVPIPATLPANAISLQYATLALGPTEFYAAPLAKYTIVPAAGSGTVIHPIQTRAFLQVVVNPSTPVAYIDGTAATPLLNFNIGSNILFSDSTILAGVADQSRFYNVVTTMLTSTLDNLPLEVGTATLPVAGNSTLYLRVLYAIVAL